MRQEGPQPPAAAVPARQPHRASRSFRHRREGQSALSNHQLGPSLRRTQLEGRPAGAAEGRGPSGARQRLPTFEEVTSATVARPIDVNGPMFFSQPLRLKAGSGQPGTWALGALVPLDSMPGEGHRVPLAVVAGVPLLCLLALLALPVLKLLTVGGRDPLSVSTVGGVTLAVLILTALATLVTLDWYAHGLAREQRDHELRVFAQLLEDGFRAELGAARTALIKFRDQRLRPALRRCAAKKGKITSPATVSLMNPASPPRQTGQVSLPRRSTDRPCSPLNFSQHSRSIRPSTCCT